MAGGRGSKCKHSREYVSVFVYTVPFKYLANQPVSFWVQNLTKYLMRQLGKPYDWLGPVGLRHPGGRSGQLSADPGIDQCGRSNVKTALVLGSVSIYT